MATLPFAGRPAFAVVVMLYFRCCNETIYCDANESQSLFRYRNKIAGVKKPAVRLVDLLILIKFKKGFLNPSVIG
jgi:hypothetical protein